MPSYLSGHEPVITVSVAPVQHILDPYRPGKNHDSACAPVNLTILDQILEIIPLNAENILPDTGNCNRFPQFP